MVKNSVFQRIWLPGFLFQSVIIGGGYATGRELVEFFLTSGPLYGLLGMLMTAAGFSLVLAISFELARLTQTYDYRTFCKQLLGRGWFLFELAYVAMALLVLAVLGAASGELVSVHLGVDPSFGVLGLMTLIGVLVFFGTPLIEKALAGWSFLLYATYAVMIFLYLTQYGGSLSSAFANIPADTQWLFDSLRYLGYSIAVVPMIIFCVRHMESRRDALLAGALAGPIGMIPAVLFFLGMSASYPDIVSAPVPADYMMQNLNLGWMQLLFYLVVFGTFVETGTALVHSVNERIHQVFVERNSVMPRWMRPAVAVLILFVAIVLAQEVGLVDLIADGYGTLTYAFILIFLLPLLSVGAWKVFKST